MLRKLLPREVGFFDIFEQHAKVILEGTREFLSLASTGANVAAKAKRVKELEHEADVITHRCVDALHKTFITPIDRDSIHRLISKMDDIMDFLEAASDRIVLYEVPPMNNELKSFADILVRCAEEVNTAVMSLKDMGNGEAVLKACVNVNRLENEADTILRNALARLFKEEKDAINIIKWQEIYQSLEEATDRCEDVANIVEGIVLEHT